jgi:putative oxidoreductase
VLVILGADISMRATILPSRSRNGPTVKRLLKAHLLTQGCCRDGLHGIKFDMVADSLETEPPGQPRPGGCPMRPLLGKWSDESYVLLRFMMGFMILCHGVQKTFGLLDGESPAQGLFLVAGVIETIGGLLIMVGLFASPVALILSGEMAVAYFMVHAGLRFWPLLNGGEIVVANCFVFLYIAAKGAGALSLDHWLDRRQSLV